MYLLCYASLQATHLVHPTSLTLARKHCGALSGVGTAGSQSKQSGKVHAKLEAALQKQQTLTGKD